MNPPASHPPSSAQTAFVLFAALCAGDEVAALCAWYGGIRWLAWFLLLKAVVDLLCAVVIAWKMDMEEARRG